MPFEAREHLPAPRHCGGRDNEDDERGEQVPAVARSDEVERLAQVDPPDEVEDQAAADGELQAGP